MNMSERQTRKEKIKQEILREVEHTRVKMVLLAGVKV
jgi:hypothetical protein